MVNCIMCWHYALFSISKCFPVCSRDRFQTGTVLYVSSLKQGQMSTDLCKIMFIFTDVMRLVCVAQCIPANRRLEKFLYTGF